MQAKGVELASRGGERSEERRRQRRGTPSNLIFTGSFSRSTHSTEFESPSTRPVYRILEHVRRAVTYSLDRYRWLTTR